MIICHKQERRQAEMNDDMKEEVLIRRMVERDPLDPAAVRL